MARLKITKRAVDAVEKPAKADTFLWDTELRGFGLRITPKGVRSYVVQYRVPGRPARRMTIGIHGSPWTPEKARDRATELLLSVKRGEDPVEATKKRKREASELEFAAYVQTFTDHYLKREWASTWADAHRRLLLHVVPHLKGKALPTIVRSDLAAILKRLSDQPALARTVHAVLRKLFAWAVGQGDIAVSPICAAPPAVKARKRVLTPDELVALWRASFGLERPMGQFVRMLVATLQRRTEVAGLPWAELSELNQMWRLPGERAKNDDDHLVPLNATARAILDDLAAGPDPQAGDKLAWKRKGLVFTTTGTTPISGFSKVKARLDRLMLPILQKMADERAEALGEEREITFLAPWRFHDIRRTGTTQMQALGVSIEVTEKVINHRSGETAGIRGVYNLHAYTDEKRAALDAWAAFLTSLIDGAKQAPNVVHLAKARA